MHHEIPGFSGSFASHDAEPVLQVLQKILMGRHVVSVSRRPADRPTVEVMREDSGRWRVASAGGEPPISFSDPVSAACCLSASLLKARMLHDRDVLCLHAAAVEIGGGLVLMPSVYRAGKSLLSVALAAGGCRLFNDDAVLLDPGSKQAIAPGIAPRLRLPLPTDLDHLTDRFITDHRGPCGTRYLYLNPPEEAHAAAGERAVVHGFVLLNRGESGAASLSPIEPGDVLRQLVWQNFARAGLADRILSCLSEIISCSQCLTLSYSSVEDARQVLMDHFEGKAAPPNEDAPVSIAGDKTFEGAVSKGPVIDEDTVVWGVQGVAVREHFGERFLLNAENDRILHVNDTAAALWTLVSQPITFRDVIDTFSTAFPDVGRAQIKSDLNVLLTVMRKYGLVHHKTSLASAEEEKPLSA